MSEWGNPAEETSVIHTPIHNVWKGTGGTETSKYPEEKKETSISKVAASEMEGAQTVVRAPRGCGLQKGTLRDSRTVLGKRIREGENPVGEILRRLAGSRVPRDT